MLYDCPDCGEAYADESPSVTLCPRCDSENTATFAKPLGAPKSSRRGAWAAGLSAALIVMVMATLAWSTLDLDDDGLSTYQEWQAGSDPFDMDTDGDGLLDGWEVERGLDPADQDSDGDGITDWAEIQGAVGAGQCASLLGLSEHCEQPPAEPSSNESIAANASATRMTAWFAVASVAIACMAGLVAARTVGKS